MGHKPRRGIQVQPKAAPATLTKDEISLVTPEAATLYRAAKLLVAAELARDAMPNRQSEDQFILARKAMRHAAIRYVTTRRGEGGYTRKLPDEPDRPDNPSD